MKSKVDFFIVGGPKCGTTSLYEYLKSHPDIFLPDVKEPSFFAHDLPGYRDIDDSNSYAALFEGAKPGQTTGEASVVYLYSKIAVQSIYEYNPLAKIIVMVRHPVNMFRSLHMQLGYTFNEDEMNPETAWHLQEKRKMGNCLPELCRDPKLIYYKEFCSLGSQINNLLTVFPDRQVLIMSVHELKKDPLAFYNKTLRFLGVDYDGRNEFPRVNSSKCHRIQWIGRLLWYLGTKKRKNLKKSQGMKKCHPGKKMLLETGLFLNKLNSKQMDKYPINNDFQNILHEEFAKEVKIIKSYVEHL